MIINCICLVLINIWQNWVALFMDFCIIQIFSIYTYKYYLFDQLEEIIVLNVWYGVYT